MEIIFILMAPARPENVGAAARALKTMGFSRLRIVASEAHLRQEAVWVAHGAQELLQQAESFPTLPEALADLDLVVATTARQRGESHRYLTPEAICGQIRSKQGLQRVGILFGCEESGLSNAQLALADLISYLPLRVGYPSLNLGQAIMLYAYELSSLLDEEQATKVDTEPAIGQVHALQGASAQILDQIGVAQDEKLRKWVMDGIPMLAQRDMNLLHLLCKDLAKALQQKRID
ncbi:MAG: tRNA/rRNA methyltransferase [Aeromonadaceae bacterium]|nr:tRNA/rRNA methyltransferase [Aeromonadaceae bacterium]